jgi:protoporphyrinogen oxidase
MGPGKLRKVADTHVTILGGGIAGIATGYYCNKNGLPFTIYEADGKVGGNCITLEHEGFLFDSGAHRIHDRNPEITTEMARLLGGVLKKVCAPSHIYRDGKLINFPISPLNIASAFGLYDVARAAIDLVRSRSSGIDPESSFEDYALYKYGRFIADRFLLNYTQKLWGVPCKQLSPSVAGARLNGINVRNLLAEFSSAGRIAPTHMEGAFYYPEGGIGVLSTKLAEACGVHRIRTCAQVTRVLHDDSRIHSIELNRSEIVKTNQVVSTLPLDVFMRVLYPEPPIDAIRTTVENIPYRALILAAFFLSKESVSRAATIYFPDSRFLFTRAYEPRNRSQEMAPHGNTSLVVEIPCMKDDSTWGMMDKEILDLAWSQILETGLVQEDDLIDSVVFRMENAYAIPDMSMSESIAMVLSYIGRYSNLRLLGRSAQHRYCWIHDLMMGGKSIVESYMQCEDSP